MSATADGAVGSAWDVVIVGAGPAGAATAITLARFGRRVLLIDAQDTPRYKLGESLPPRAVGLVKHFLGDLDSPQQPFQGVTQTAGNISVWGRDEADVSDFFFTQTGFGLCIQRVAFDEALRVKAADAGAIVSKGVRFEDCIPIDDGLFNWQLKVSAKSGTHHHRTRYVVDGTGRRARVACLLGKQRIHADDQLFAYAQWFSSSEEDDDRYTRIEATPHGWWYSNRLPLVEGGQAMRLVVFHADKDLPEARLAASPAGFEQLLAQSVHIGPLVRGRGYQPYGAIRGAPANSQRVEAYCGNAWMAVGDAAQAYDPLSSQGIEKALRTGSHAGHMIHYALEDGAQAVSQLGQRNPYLQQYDEQQQQLWQTYYSELQSYYRMQPRWSDHPFWQRRR